MARCIGLEGVWSRLCAWLACSCGLASVVITIIVVTAVVMCRSCSGPKSRCECRSSIRPVLKHGPRSLACARVIGWKTYWRNESKGRLDRLIWDPFGFGQAAHHSPVLTACSRAEVERTRWDPKDGELCLSRMKPEETLVEVRNDSDVQIDRLT